MSAIPSGTPLFTFAEALRQATTGVFSQALSTPWSVELSEQMPADDAKSGRLAFKLTFSGGLKGEATLVTQKHNALVLAQKFLGEEANPTAELTNDHEQAAEELFRQVGGVAQTALSGHFGEVKLELSPTPVSPWAGTTVCLLVSESAQKFHLLVEVTPELMEALSARNQPAPPEDEPANPPNANENLALLLGIDLDLNLRFGKNSLMLREILDLSQGSVVEVDRQVQEPVELLLADRLIARGEVVVIQENYGLRITEVSSAAVPGTPPA
jgi:flagellar motor switch protein FliN